MKHLLQIIFLTVILQTFAPSGYGSAGDVDEYLLKAAFFERFTRFVDYGPAPPTQDRLFIITVFGNNPFGNRLEQVYQNQRILKRKVKLVYIDSLEQLGTSDILYIGADKKPEMNRLLLLIESERTITIADSPELSGSGVMINLLLFDDKIRFEIDVKAANKQNIKFDRTLLSNAIIVNP